MTTRRTIIGSLCGLLALPFVAQAKEKTQLQGIVATKIEPIRSTVCLSLEDYDKLKKDADSYLAIKKDIAKSRKDLFAHRTEEDLWMTVCSKSDGSVVPCNNSMPRA
jgi:hypothetical protein